jgi:hypothetical protein
VLLSTTGALDTLPPLPLRTCGGSESASRTSLAYSYRLLHGWRQDDYELARAQMWNWYVSWNDKEHSELVGHHLLSFLSTVKDCAMYICILDGCCHPSTRCTATFGRLRLSPTLSSQIVIYLRHNPCSLHGI